MKPEFLNSLFQAAVSAADPAICVVPHLPDMPDGRCLVLGAGKAAASMARAVETAWADTPGFKERLSGVVVTRYEHGVPCEAIEVIEAAHPVPDAAGRNAAGRILDLAVNAEAGDLVLCLISGGGSALLALPGEGLDLADKQAVNSALLKSGAAIDEMNCVRKHLSAIKGGRLAAAAYPARVLTLAISDVPGDDPAVIASGPTVADPTTLADALAVFEKYGVEPSQKVSRHLAQASSETLKPGDERLSLTDFRMIATPQMALEAAARVCRDQGLEPVILGDDIEGEARDVARSHAELAGRQSPGTVLLSGGETTVTVRGSGRGGRNAEYSLALALALDGAEGISAIACDTDGIDGTEDNAGCIVRPDTLSRANLGGLDGVAYLADNNAYTFFKGLGDLVISGPTLTNVNDFRAILIE